MPRAARDPDQDLRLVRFGSFVRDELEKAMARGMTIKQIEEATGVSKSTFYRWRDAGVVPAVEQVRSFCAALGASVTDAYARLGWSERTAPPPKRDQLIDDPDLRLLLRKLTSTKTPPAEKLWIRRQIKALAAGIEDQPGQE
jgi:transcriptional regulator with XRE-family HTH domain